MEKVIYEGINFALLRVADVSLFLFLLFLLAASVARRKIWEESICDLFERATESSLLILVLILYIGGLIESSYEFPKNWSWSEAIFNLFFCLFFLSFFYGVTKVVFFLAEEDMGHKYSETYPETYFGEYSTYDGVHSADDRGPCKIAGCNGHYYPVLEKIGEYYDECHYLGDQTVWVCRCSECGDQLW